MKKLIIKIGNEKHELPYNGEAVSFEVIDGYVPKVGDCIMANWGEQGCAAFFKIVSINNDGDIKSEHYVDLHKGEYKIDLNWGWFRGTTKFTQITPEELKAEYAEAGYDWDYETNEVKPSKWMPKEGDEVWWLNSIHEPVSRIFDKDDVFCQLMAVKGFLFQTKEKCKEFAEYCLNFYKK